MESLGELLNHDLLDLLVEGPSSVAALYGALIRYCGYPSGLDVSRVVDALESMERRDWVEAWQTASDGSFHKPTTEERGRARVAYEAWLPGAENEDLSLDEVGLWYEITTVGRAEWNQWSGRVAQPHGNRWMLDDSRETQLATIHAESLAVAEEVLHWWLTSRPEIELVTCNKRVELVPSFTLRDGTVIRNGVRLVAKYRVSKVK